MIAANAPDVDVLSYVRGEYFALAFRRGITHGVPALLILPLLVAAAVLAWDRGIRLRRDPSAPPARAGPILALSALGVATHPTLDWLNTYGMRWWLPLRGTWSYGDTLFIVDPWIWLALGGAVFLAGPRSRRTSSAWAVLVALASLLVVGSGGAGVGLLWCAGLALVVVLGLREESSARAPHAAPRAALAGMTVYVALLAVANRAARGEVLLAAEAAGLTVRDVMVVPSPADPLRSEVEVLTDEALVPGAHAWLRRPRVSLRPESAVPLLTFPPEMTEARVRAVTEAAADRAAVRDYLVWSRYPYVRVRTEGAGWRVSFSDARYDGRPELGGLSGVTAWVPESEVP